MAASEGYGGPFGDYIGAMLGSLGLSWRLLKAMVGHLGPMLGLSWGSVGALLGLSWDYIQQLGALLAACEGYGGPFGDYIGAMLGSLGLSWQLLKAMVGFGDYIGAMVGSLGLSCSSLGALLELYSAAWGSLGGF